MCGVHPTAQKWQVNFYHRKNNKQQCVYEHVRKLNFLQLEGHVNIIFQQEATLLHFGNVMQQSLNVQHLNK
jgi:hypothetical protein